MPYATATHLAGLMTSGWLELAQRACPQSPDMPADLVRALVNGQDTSSWTPELVMQAQEGVDRVHLALDMASRHVDTYLYPKYRSQMPLPPEVVAASPLPDVVGWLAVKRLYGAAVPEDVEQASRWANDYLRDLSRGTVSLGVGDAVQPPPGAVVARTPDKRFDWGAY